MLKYITTSLRFIYQSFIEEAGRLKRDSGALLIIVFAVIIYPLVYSIAYKNNVLQNIPLAVVDLDQSALSRKTTQMIDATPQTNISYGVGSMKEAENLFWEGKVKGVILIPENYEKQVYRGEATHIGVYCDVSYFLIYKETLTAGLQSIGTVSAGVEIKRLMAAGLNQNQALTARNPLPLTIYNLYNPTSGYGNYVMPGLILVILQQTLLVGIGLMGGGRKEKNKLTPGVAEQAIGFNMWPVVLGRSLVYFLVSLLNCAFALVMIHHWFDFPNQGNIINLLMLLVPFLLATIFMGKSISHLFKRREHAIMFLVFLSPVILFLSGLSWPKYAIPKVLYLISHIFPSTFVVPGYLRLRTMGVSLHDVEFEYWGLFIQSLVYFVIAVITTRYNTKKAINQST